MTDEMLRALKRNGGVIQLVALGSCIKPPNPEYVKAMAELEARVRELTRGLPAGIIPPA